MKWIQLILEKMKPFVDFKKIRGVESFQWIGDEKGGLKKFVFEAGPARIYEIEKSPQRGYLIKKKKIPLQIVLKKAEGVINTYLMTAVRAAGEQPSLANALEEILSWKLDFTKDIRKGDRFKVVVEKIYKGDEFIKYGAVQALEYQSGKKRIRGILFENRYFDEKGYSLEKSFLKAPLRFDYISSGFNRRRKHPIMGGIHPHLGIDYAAPLGTPVWASADGVVVWRGREKGNGKAVIIQHSNRYKSYYSHLSKYRLGIKVGKRVGQKQIIGYVGSTGLSTGAHLDFRITKNGRFINPLKEDFPTVKAIKQRDWKAFCKTRAQALDWLNEL